MSIKRKWNACFRPRENKNCQLFTLTFTFMGHLKYSLNLICMLLGCVRKPAYPEFKPRTNHCLNLQNFFVCFLFLLSPHQTNLNNTLSSQNRMCCAHYRAVHYDIYCTNDGSKAVSRQVCVCVCIDNREKLIKSGLNKKERKFSTPQRLYITLFAIGCSSRIYSRPTALLLVHHITSTFTVSGRCYVSQIPPLSTMVCACSFCIVLSLSLSLYCLVVFACVSSFVYIYLEGIIFLCHCLRLGS